MAIKMYNQWMIRMDKCVMYMIQAKEVIYFKLGLKTKRFYLIIKNIYILQKIKVI